MLFNFFNSLRDTKEESIFLSSFVDYLNDVKDKINERLEEINIDKSKNLEKEELYYVYSYTPEKVYITKQKSNKLELLEGVSDDFKRNLAEGFILRYKDGKYSIDEVLTEKSMNFELDFDNCNEK